MTVVRITKEDTAHEHTFTPRTSPAQPLRTFDLRTSEERLVMWCAHLEMELEAQAKRLTHIELWQHRMLNSGPARPSGKAAPMDEAVAGEAAAQILAFLERDCAHDPAWALDLLHYSTPNSVYITLREDIHTTFTAEEIAAGYYLLIRRLEEKVRNG